MNNIQFHHWSISLMWRMSIQKSNLHPEGLDTSVVIYIALVSNFHRCKTGSQNPQWCKLRLKPLKLWVRKNTFLFILGFQLSTHYKWFFKNLILKERNLKIFSDILYPVFLNTLAKHYTSLWFTKFLWVLHIC